MIYMIIYHLNKNKNNNKTTTKQQQKWFWIKVRICFSNSLFFVRIYSFIAKKKDFKQFIICNIFK